VQGSNLLIPERREKARERETKASEKERRISGRSKRAVNHKTTKKIQEGDEKMTIATKRAAKRQTRNHERQQKEGRKAGQQQL
jgi:hypothetical protein